MPLLIPLAVLIVVGAIVAIALSLRASAHATREEERAAAHLTRVRWLTVLAMAAVFALCAAGLGNLGQGILLAPAVAGAVGACVLAIGERTIPRSAASSRRASLEPRSASRSITGPVRTAAVAATSALLALFALGWATATADGQGRSGRAVEWATRDGSQGHSPWPGPFYSIPTTLALLVAGIAFAVGMRSVVERPQVNADATAARADGQLRQRSSMLMQAVLLASLGATLAGVCLVTAGATSSAAAGSPGWVAVAHWGALAGGALSAWVMLLAAWKTVQR